MSGINSWYCLTSPCGSEPSNGMEVLCCLNVAIVMDEEQKFTWRRLHEAFYPMVYLRRDIPGRRYEIAGLGLSLAELICRAMNIHAI